MGCKVTQVIYQCGKCGITPDDGEDMWRMGYEVWCEKCCDTEEKDKTNEK